MTGNRPAEQGTRTAIGVLAAISLCHGLNDLLQSVLPAVYPLLKERYLLVMVQPVDHRQAYASRGKQGSTVLISIFPEISK